MKDCEFDVFLPEGDGPEGAAKLFEIEEQGELLLYCRFKFLSEAVVLLIPCVLSECVPRWEIPDRVPDWDYDDGEVLEAAVEMESVWWSFDI